MKRRLLTAISVVLTATLSLTLLASVLVSDYKDYLAESKCVAKYIKYKVHRHKIKTSNGKCTVELMANNISAYGLQ